MQIQVVQSQLWMEHFVNVNTNLGYKFLELIYYLNVLMEWLAP